MKTTAERRLEFEYLISSAELDIHQNPRAYQIKVALFALLGYAVILGMLALLLAMIGGIAWAAMAGKAVLLMLLAKKIIFVIPVMIFIIVTLVVHYSYRFWANTAHYWPVEDQMTLAHDKMADIVYLQSDWIIEKVLNIPVTLGENRYYYFQNGGFIAINQS